jgi:hypothetical protein
MLLLRGKSTYPTCSDFPNQLKDLAKASEERQSLAVKQTELLVDMLKQNNKMTEEIKNLTERLETLTKEVHQKVLN